MSGEVSVPRSEMAFTASGRPLRLSKLERDNYLLLGNGQPGRLGTLEEDVRKLQQWRKYVLGYVAGGSVVVGGVISFIAWILKG